MRQHVQRPPQILPQRHLRAASRHIAPSERFDPYRAIRLAVVLGLGVFWYLVANAAF